jgi:hypothetical protein
MKFADLLKQSGRITLGRWQLWLLTAAMSLTFIPALLVGGSFGSIATVLTLPLQGEFATILAPLQDISSLAWLLLAGTSLVVMVFSTAVSCALQAAAMRCSAACADGSPLGLTGSLRLGRQRFVDILKLSILYGLLIAAIALLPPLLLLSVPDDSFAVTVTNTLGTTLAPLNSVLGVVILLVLMSVALEDVRAETAVNRTWSVFKTGWKEFIGVICISIGTGIIQALLLVPFLVLLVMTVLMQIEWMYVFLCGVISVPLVLLAWLGTGVFTLVLYTLVYREAAAKVYSSS